MAYYWDTSAILKLYAPEPDSAYFLDLIVESGGQILSSAIASTEVFCALFRKEHSADLKTGGAKALWRRFRGDCRAGRIVLIPYGRDVAEEAERLGKMAFRQSPPVMIRSLDLIHVASASVAKSATLVATDDRIRILGLLLKIRLLP